MIDFKKVFQALSYLQYPLMAVALYYMVIPFVLGLNSYDLNINLLFDSFGNVLVFLGLAISFSTLQDTSKSQHKFARKIWQDPKKGRIFLLIMMFNVVVYLSFGICAYLFLDNPLLKELGFGSIILGISLIGMLKMGVEMLEKQRLDKTSRSEIVD